LTLQLGRSGENAQIQNKIYWQIDFPDQGQEDYGKDAKSLVDEFDKVMLAAVDRRLRADVPVVSYLSGGIDSSLVVAMAAKIRGKSIPTFTIQIMTPHLDETSQAAVVSRHIGATPVVVQVGDAEVLAHYPELIRAAEAPVIDTSCTALLMLARSVHQHGYKVALTGEGSDEWLAGYGWHKFHRLAGFLDIIPGLKLSQVLRRIVVRGMGAPPGAWDYVRRIQQVLGDHTAYQDIYGVVGVNRLRFYSEKTLTQLGDYLPYVDLEPDFARIRRWHPLNRSFYWAGRIHLPGQLLSLKGDRVAMNSSVETRYPFLDEEVFSFLARIPPRWKLHGLREKYILRLLGERYLPKEVAWRKKGMFRAPLNSFFQLHAQPYARQLLSEESLKKTGYFNVEAVRSWLKIMQEGKLKYTQRSSVELGLVGVVTTQLWHHIFVDGSLADIPSGWSRPPLVA
jgi:asparagine synthase (glutamine-hydrolysing)